MHIIGKSESPRVLCLGRYTFRPYDEAAVGSGDATRSKRDALVVSLQLVLENCGSLRLKAVEAALGRAPEALLAPLALQALDAEPEVRVDASLAAGADASKYAAAMKDIGVKVNYLFLEFQLVHTL